MTEWLRLLCAASSLFGGTGGACAQPPPRAPEYCLALAQFGAFDTRAATGDADRAASFRNWFCQANIAAESDLRAAAAALGIVPEVLEARFGFDPGGSVDFLDWKHGLCAMARSDRRTGEQVSDFVKGITATVTKALAQCDAPPGLHARLESTAKRCDTLVRLSWTPMADTKPPADVQLFSTNPHLACQPTPLETPFPVTGPTDLLCSRHDDTAAMVMMASPSLRMARLDRMMELPQVLPDPQALLAGEYDVDIAWRDRAGKFSSPTSDIWKLDLSSGACRITGSGTAYSPRSAWFNQSAAICSPTQIQFTGFRSYDPTTKKPGKFDLTLQSEDNGATFVGTGADSAGNVAVQATARRKATRAAADQVVCKP